MKIFIFVLLFLCARFVAQTNVSRPNRVFLSKETNTVVMRFDSLLCDSTFKRCGSGVESKYLGEGSKKSSLYFVYSELVKQANETELIQLIENTKELLTIRAYAYMAYALKCDQEKKKEKPVNIKHIIFMQIGCVGSKYTFEQFKAKIRVRGLYNPNPSHILKDLEEERVRKLENKIRKEQGESLLKK